MVSEISPQGMPRGQLTRFRAGSMREVWVVSYPLMLAELSIFLMIFVDRLLLANYSINAMKSVVAAGITFAIFDIGAVTIVTIAEVFVGQHNGAKQYIRVGEPVWQMLWFSALTAIIFWPVAYVVAPHLLVSVYLKHGLPYLQWLLYFGPVFTANMAVTSFFIGIGKVYTVTLITVLANIVNFFLGIILIFGVNNTIPAMGSAGAAIASVIAHVFQFLILLSIFLKEDNRKKYGTSRYYFNFESFWQCLKIGSPNSIAVIIEISGWAIIANLIAKVSLAHSTTFAIGQSIGLLFMFILTGIQKGVTTLASNYIGAKQLDRVYSVHLSAIWVHLCLVTGLGIPLILYPDLLIDGFLAEHLSTENLDHLRKLAENACLWVWLWFLVDGVTWISAGVLNAGGDTKFTMVANVFNVWIFCIIPIYYFIVKNGGSTQLMFILIAFYATMNMGCFFMRYKQGKWKFINIVTTQGCKL